MIFFYQKVTRVSSFLALILSLILTTACSGKEGDFSSKKISENIENIDVCFSAVEDCRALILKKILSANNTIDVAVYSLTNIELSRALIEAHSKGIITRVISDDKQSSGKYSKTQYLADNGIPVRYDGSTGYMHHKFTVIDNAVILTGSYNWSNSAENKNDENLLLIRDKKLARKYTNEFERLWEKCK
ncbi:phospholipase D family protein [bacterium]|nr:phospholipase D family protein [bacterium]